MLFTALFNVAAGYVDSGHPSRTSPTTTARRWWSPPRRWYCDPPPTSSRRTPSSWNDQELAQCLRDVGGVDFGLFQEVVRVAPVIWCWKTRREILTGPNGGGGGGGGEGDSSRLSDGPTSDILNGLSFEKCINHKNCPVTATLDFHDVRDLRLHTSYLHTY
jgi:hypothetical protein